MAAEFFKLVDGCLVNKRACLEIAKKETKKKAAQTNGKRGGRPKNNSPGSENTTQEKPTGFPPGSENTTQEKAHQSPVTSNQSPVNSSSSLQCGNPAPARGDDEKPRNPAEWAAVFAEQHGVAVDPGSVHDRKKFWPLATAWVAAGVTVGQMRAACSRAFAEAKEPISWLPGYADRVLASMVAVQKQQQSAQSFRERDDAIGRQRWEQMTGRVHPDNEPQVSANVIDITPKFLEIAQ